MPETSTARPGGADTAKRALRVLDVVGRSEQPLMLEEVVRQTGFGRSMTYRLLRALQEEEFLEHAPGGGYSVGGRLYSLAAAVLPSFDTDNAYLPLLQTIAAESGETCTLHRRVGASVVLVLGAESTLHPLRRVWTPGELTPVVRGSAGTALLANLDQDELTAVLDTLPAEATSGVRERAAEARKLGYVLSFGANHPGVHGVATPVPGADLAVSVSGPGHRWTQERMTAFAPHLIELVHTFSRPAPRG
ncbi:IclR family transcriptional regulator [Streptomyces althioticus]|uniref:IclR family transcriptional regulator n=1 Tax=Streptomyces althioticus TaxID=83380 RepID=UPI00368D9E33